jgi:hypothetical protein
MSQGALEVYRDTISMKDSDLGGKFLESMRVNGFALVTDCYSAIELELMKAALLEVEKRESVEDPTFIWQEGKMWAIWNLYEHSPELMRLSFKHGAMGLMRGYFGEDVHFCRGTLMKKIPSAGQSMIWHQDRPAPVDREQADGDSVGVRAGVPHRQLSIDTITNHYMIARVHLEEQFADGGALMVVPGSNKLGLLAVKDWRAAAMERKQVLVAAPAGSILFASPMTLHASGPNSRTDPNNHRRVLHNEFRTASSTPCAGFGWYQWAHGAVVREKSVEFFG